MSRFVKPETSTLTLANGDRLIVKKELTCGEQRRAHARLYQLGADNQLRPNPLQMGISKITAYLLDWTLTDDEGRPVPIRGLAPEELEVVIDALDNASFREIREAIDTHETMMVAASLEKKPPPITANGSGVISTSVS